MLFSNSNTPVFNPDSLLLSIPAEEKDSISLASISVDMAIEALSHVWKTDMTPEYISGYFGLFASNVNWKEPLFIENIEAVRKIERSNVMRISISMKRLKSQNTMTLNQLLNFPHEQDVFSNLQYFKPAKTVLVEEEQNDNFIPVHFKNGNFYDYDTTFDRQTFKEVNQLYFFIMNRAR
ncbi:hypothetical protein AYI68_g2857 [Smittium mucronatum]|uniref:Uncharacterized protein n=1 Tax=Smittium mucronatum TaxID=133383 RepID=A0A1R0H1J2_9FUNG|nr:hypothetical protein AYI68_g2857 [Smittium mucronatum]